MSGFRILQSVQNYSLWTTYAIKNIYSLQNIYERTTTIIGMKDMFIR